MKIQLKRNTAAGTSLPTLSAGEPVWCDDKLYIGATGAMTVAAGTAIRIARYDEIPTITGSNITLSTTAQTFLTVGSTAYTIKMPSSDPWAANYASSSHNHGNITNGGDITSNVAIASGDRLVINDESASKLANSTITFGNSTTTFLANNGTWQTPQGGGGTTEWNDIQNNPFTNNQISTFTMVCTDDNGNTYTYNVVAVDQPIQ